LFTIRQVGKRVRKGDGVKRRKGGARETLHVFLQL